jgi:hypothetical protein
MLDTGYWMLDVGYWMLDDGYVGDRILFYNHNSIILIFDF